MELPLACTLTPDGARAQAARQRALGGSAVAAVREADAIRVTFDATLDRALLAETVAVERECCPFLTLTFDEAARTLTIAVDDPDHRDALDVIAEGLGVSRRHSAK